MGKKITTTVTAGRNGGIHDVRRYKAACKWIKEHTFSNAQLWHMVFKGSSDRKMYQAALDRLCEKLRDSGMEVEWRAAYEMDPIKGFHRHVFLLIEAAKHKPVAILRFKEGNWLTEMLKRHGLQFYISNPKSPVHLTRKGKPKKYAYVPKKAGAVLDDCTNWLSYIFKVRSKEGVEGSIYSSSRKKAKKADAKPVQQAETEQARQAEPVAQDAPTAQPTTNEINDKEGEAAMTANNGLSPAGHAYIERLYQGFVDRGLDVGQIRKELIGAGIRRTEGQVVYDLEERYGFTSYAALYPAKRMPTWDELDAIENAKAAKPARILRRPVSGQGLAA